MTVFIELTKIAEDYQHQKIQVNPAWIIMLFPFNQATLVYTRDFPNPIEVVESSDKIVELVAQAEWAAAGHDLYQGRPGE